METYLIPTIRFRQPLPSVFANAAVTLSHRHGGASRSKLRTTPEAFRHRAAWVKARILCSLLLLLLGCCDVRAAPAGGTAGTQSSTPPVTISVSPAAAKVASGVGLQLTATVTGSSDTPLVWSVNGVAWGNADLGTVNKYGYYKAPASSTSGIKFSVTAASAKDSKITATATIIIQNTVVVTPSTLTLEGGKTQQFLSKVNNNPHTAVTWMVHDIVGGNAEFGTVSTTGLYRAPLRPPATAVPVTAVDPADSTAWGQTYVTVLAPPVVTITPSSVSVAVGQSAKFTGTIAGNVVGMTWLVSGVVGGNASVGRISATGSYVAPLTVPAGTLIITAVGLADNSAQGSASVKVMPAAKVNLSPASASVIVGQSLQFVATVTGGAGGTAVNWKVAGVSGGNPSVGTISASGLYTAPLTSPPSAVTITAVDAADSTASASASATVKPDPATISLNPTLVSLTPGQTQHFLATLSNASAGATVNWLVGGIAGGNSTVGTISSAGVYSAPAKASSAGVIITAVDSEDRAIAATASVSFTASSPSVVQNQQWLDGAPKAAAIYGCTSVAVQQQPTESVGDAVSVFVETATEGSCLVLQPISTNPANTRYSFSWGGLVNGIDIWYISDVGEMRIWNGAALAPK